MIINRNLGIGLVLGLVLSLSGCFSDVENVDLNIRVEKNGLGVEYFTLIVTNYYYGEGDMEAYVAPEVYELKTNKNGKCSLQLKQSAYVQIDTVRTGYSGLFVERYIYKKNINMTVTLKD